MKHQSVTQAIYVMGEKKKRLSVNFIWIHRTGVEWAWLERWHTWEGCHGTVEGLTPLLTASASAAVSSHRHPALYCMVCVGAVNVTVQWNSDSAWTYRGWRMCKSHFHPDRQFRHSCTPMYMCNEEWGVSNIAISIFGNMFCVTALILLMSFHHLCLYGSLLCDMLCGSRVKAHDVFSLTATGRPCWCGSSKAPESALLALIPSCDWAL